MTDNYDDPRWLDNELERLKKFMTLTPNGIDFDYYHKPSSDIVLNRILFEDAYLEDKGMYKDLYVLNEICKSLNERGIPYLCGGQSPNLFILYALGVTKTNPLPSECMQRKVEECSDDISDTDDIEELVESICNEDDSTLRLGPTDPFANKASSDPFDFQSNLIKTQDHQKLLKLENEEDIFPFPTYLIIHPSFKEFLLKSGTDPRQTIQTKKPIRPIKFNLQVSPDDYSEVLHKAITLYNAISKDTEPKVYCEGCLACDFGSLMVEGHFSAQSRVDFQNYVNYLDHVAPQQDLESAKHKANQIEALLNFNIIDRVTYNQFTAPKHTGEGNLRAVTLLKTYGLTHLTCENGAIKKLAETYPILEDIPVFYEEVYKDLLGCGVPLEEALEAAHKAHFGTLTTEDLNTLDQKYNLSKHNCYFTSLVDWLSSIKYMFSLFHSAEVLRSYGIDFDFVEIF